ncbi:MAG: ATP-binding cassette domain-containing protein [Gemmatimonadaceae bacterium]|nr:ATP-binding cassette domain-containing protein [Gemmatimonadaceae bacterium]
MTERFELLGWRVSFGTRDVLRDVHARIPARGVTALVGPSGGGKSTLLRSLNRLVDEVPGVRLGGRILLDGEDLRRRALPAVVLRQRVAMVGQQPVALPMSIFENVAYGARLAGVRGAALRTRVHEALERALLADEVAQRLDDDAMGLSGGQLQRLALARCFALEPDVLLLDEPTSALDPMASAHFERVVAEVAQDRTVVLVTHHLAQAVRLARHILTLEDGHATPGWSRDAQATIARSGAEPRADEGRRRADLDEALSVP